MSRHWRLCVWALLPFAALSTSSAFSNPLADLFNAAPKETTAPTPVAAREECLLRPGRSVARGQHWVYHLDGHRKCWFQAAEGTVPVKKQVRHHFVKRPVIASEENEAELRKSVANARAQLLRADPADAPRRTTTPGIVDAAAGSADEVTSLTPVIPVDDKRANDQLAADSTTPRSVDVEKLLAEVPSAGNTVGLSMPPAIASALSTPEASEGWWEWMVAPAGVMLIGLGLVSLLASLVAGLFLDTGVGAVHRT